MKWKAKIAKDNFFESKEINKSPVNLNHQQTKEKGKPGNFLIV